MVFDFWPMLEVTFFNAFNITEKSSSSNNNSYHVLRHIMEIMWYEHQSTKLTHTQWGDRMTAIKYVLCAVCLKCNTRLYYICIACCSNRFSGNKVPSLFQTCTKSHTQTLMYTLITHEMCGIIWNIFEPTKRTTNTHTRQSHSGRKVSKVKCLESQNISNFMIYANHRGQFSVALFCSKLKSRAWHVCEINGSWYIYAICMHKMR